MPDITLDAPKITLDQEPKGPLFGGGEFRGSGASAQWGPNRSTMRGEPPRGFKPISLEQVGEQLPMMVAIATAALQPTVGVPLLARMGIGSKITQLFVQGLARIAGQATAAGVTGAAVASAEGQRTGEAVESGIEAGKHAGKMAAIGEGLGLTIRGVAEGVRAAAPHVKGFFQRGTFAGRQAAKEIESAVSEQANLDAAAIVKKVSETAPKELTGQQVGEMAKTFETVTANRATQLRDAAITTAASAKRTVDITPILKDLKDALTAAEQRGGALSPFVGAESRALEAAQGARLGTTNVSKLGKLAARRAQEEIEGRGVAELTEGPEAATVEALLQKIKAVLTAKKADVSALMNIQGDISQILSAPLESVPFQLRRVALRIGGGTPEKPLGRLHELITDELEKIGPEVADQWTAALDYMKRISDIKKQGLYGLAKKMPEKIHEFIAPNQPATSRALVEMLEETGQYTELMPRIQRNWLEARVAEGLGDFSKNVEAFGPKTVGILVGKGAAKVALENLKKLSVSFSEKMEAVGAGAEATRAKLADALTKSGMTAATASAGGTAGYYEGRRRGGAVGGAVGGVLGAGAGIIAPYAIVRLSYNPAAVKRITAMLDGMSSDVTPRTLDAFTQTIKNGLKDSREPKEAPSAGPQR